jgi:hypothetical protein
MFGSFGLIPDLQDVDVEEKPVKPEPLDIIPGDIVSVATRWGKAVAREADDFDSMATARVLGWAQGDRVIYMLLVTEADYKHILPTARVDKRMIREYGIENRFLGEEAVVVSDLQLRSVVKEQRGRWCEKCDEYNEDVRTDHSQVYFCSTCRENPWR